MPTAHSPGAAPQSSAPAPSPAPPPPSPESEESANEERPSLARRLRRLIVGRPRDLAESGLFHRLALIPFLAWVGLGADGLSSSAYGPEEAYRALGEYPFLALVLALIMATTVLLISAGYARIIEEFPSGGGGYVVATKLLGSTTGVISGCALLVDYVLTITTSLAAAGNALFSFLPPEWHGAKLGVEVGLVAFLTALNIRGVRESVLALVPVFLLFLVTHALLIGGGIFGHLPELSKHGAARRRRISRGRSNPRGRRPAAPPGEGVQLGRWDLHGYRGGLERLADHEGAAGQDGAAHDDLHGEFARHHRQRTAPLLSALACSAGAWQDAQRRAGRARHRGAAVRVGLLRGDLGRRGDAPRSGRAGRLPRRPAGAGEHGDRQLDAAPLRGAFRAADHPERHRAHGRGSPRCAPLHSTAT